MARKAADQNKPTGRGGARKPRVEVAQEIDPLMEQSLQDFAYLFGDGSEGTKVELYRVSPKVYQGQQTSGFLEDLQPGTDRAYIRNTYGGGTYRLTVRNAKGQIETHHPLLIAGLPKVESAPPEPEAREDRGSEQGLTVREFDGVQLGDKMMEELRQMLIIKKVLAEPDRDYEVLKMLLPLVTSGGQAAPSLLGQVSDVMEVVSKVKELLPSESGGTGSNFMDILREGLVAFREFVKVRGGGLSGLPAGSMPGLLPGNEAGDAGNQDLKLLTEKPNPEDVNVADQVNQVAQQAVGIIVQNFRLQSEPADVVELLNDVVPIPQAMREAALRDRRKKLELLANTQLSDLDPDFADGEAREAFKQFFEQVWTGFVVGAAKP